MIPSKESASASARDPMCKGHTPIPGSLTSAEGGEGSAKGSSASRFGTSAELLARVLLRYRGLILIAFHILAFGAIYLVSYVIRFDGLIPSAELALAWTSLPLVVGLKLAV